MESGNRDNIIQTALTLFANKGYESTGVQEIVDTAGISKPTLYHYFGNKRGLLEAILSSNGKTLYELIANGCVYNHNLVLNLTSLTRGVISFAQENQPFFRFYQALAASAPETQGYMACVNLRKRINECIEKLFIEASLDHGNMKGRHKPYSHAFQGMYNTWAMLVLNKEIELNDETIARAVHQFMHGIFS